MLGLRVEKILFGIIDVDVIRSLFVLRPNDRPTRGHSYKLLQEHCVTDTRKRFSASESQVFGTVCLRRLSTLQVIVLLRRLFET